MIPKTVDYSIYEEPLYWDNKETATPGYGSWEHWPEIASLFREVLGIEYLLDVGCGPGHLVNCYDTFLGIDLSRFAQTVSPCPSRILNGDAANLPWGDRSFDGVFSGSFLEHVPPSKLDKVLSEMFRVTKRWMILSLPTLDAYKNMKNDERSGMEEILFEGGDIPESYSKIAKEQISRGHWNIRPKSWWISKLSEYGEFDEEAKSKLLNHTSKVVPVTDSAWTANDPGLFVLTKPQRPDGLEGKL